MSTSDKDLVSIWLYPDEETTVSLKTLAEYVGVSLQTLKERMVRLGPDHYLTYYPGNIPSKVRRIGGKTVNGAKRSRLKDIKVERLNGSIDSELAYDFVIKLISFSKRDFTLRGCEESKNFLLNKNQMLEWYIECIPGIDCERFLKDMVRWVDANTPEKP